MALLSTEVRAAMEKSVLCWLASVDPAGRPNVSPKEVFLAHGEDQVLIAHVASPGSARNIRGNPAVCVSFVDVFVQKGFKLSGRAELLEPGTPRFDALKGPLEAVTRGLFPLQAIFLVTVEAVAPIVAPSYRLIAGTTEASQVAGAMARYGVRPRDLQSGE